ncbi:molybdenum cofactor guanylyltransferase [Anaplasmataceae bacterium AB001_6]|nr:molybdenum cofactor guanylyltransferase [Anaplasmataceae bacterium AB001_6]
MIIAGVILAGGKSSRMKVDKTKLIYQNTTLLDRMDNLLKNAGIENVYISGAAGINDKIKDKGPLCGVHATLTELLEKYDFLLYAPVDMPKLNIHLLYKLINAPHENDIVCFENYILPFRLKVKAETINIIEKIFKEKKDFSLKNLHKTLISHNLSVNQKEIDSFVNINTPDEWKNIQDKV